MQDVGCWLVFNIVCVCVCVCAMEGEREREIYWPYWIIFFFFCDISYLHHNNIIHGNISLATIFIQHNGLVKIGSGKCAISNCCCIVLKTALMKSVSNKIVLVVMSFSTWIHTSVSPDAIHEHVKTKTEETKRLHYAAPELATAGQTTAADIFSFGICTLEVSGSPHDTCIVCKHFSTETFRQ